MLAQPHLNKAGASSCFSVSSILHEVPFPESWRGLHMHQFRNLFNVALADEIGGVEETQAALEKALANSRLNLFPIRIAGDEVTF